MSDFNAFDGTSSNSFRDSGYDARGLSIPFTVRFWFKFAELGEGFGDIIVLGPAWFVQIEGGAIFMQEGGGKGAHPFGLFSATDWNYFLCGFDGEKLFARLNAGPLTWSAPLVGTAPFGPGFTINLSWLKFSPFLTGDAAAAIDEVAVWKDRALSQEDSDTDYNAGAGLDFVEVDKEKLLAYWELNGGGEAGNLIDSLNGYELERIDFGTGRSTVYDSGKFGTGLKNVSGVTGTDVDSTRFSTTDEAFSFGEA